MFFLNKSWRVRDEHLQTETQLLALPRLHAVQELSRKIRQDIRIGALNAVQQAQEAQPLLRCPRPRQVRQNSVQQLTHAGHQLRPLLLGRHFQNETQAAGSADANLLLAVLTLAEDLLEERGIAESGRVGDALP